MEMALWVGMNSKPEGLSRIELENRYGSLAHREFKSVPLRHLRAMEHRELIEPLGGLARQALQKSRRRSRRIGRPKPSRVTCRGFVHLRGGENPVDRGRQRDLAAVASRPDLANSKPVSPRRNPRLIAPPGHQHHRLAFPACLHDRAGT